MIISLALMAFLSLLLWSEWGNFKGRIVEHELRQMVDSYPDLSTDSYCIRCGIPHEPGKCQR